MKLMSAAAVDCVVSDYESRSMFLHKQLYVTIADFLFDRRRRMQYYALALLLVRLTILSVSDSRIMAGHQSLRLKRRTLLAPALLYDLRILKQQPDRVAPYFY